MVRDDDDDGYDDTDVIKVLFIIDRQTTSNFKNVFISESSSLGFENQTYEPIWPAAPMSPTTPIPNKDEDDYSWGSSEFESYDEDEAAGDKVKGQANGTSANDMDAAHEVYSKAEITVKTPEV